MEIGLALLLNSPQKVLAMEGLLQVCQVTAKQATQKTQVRKCTDMTKAKLKKPTIF